MLTAGDPDEAKAVPQPAIKVHPARPVQANHASHANQANETRRARPPHQAGPVRQTRRVLPAPVYTDPDDVKTAPQPAIRIPIPEASPAQPGPGAPGQPGRSGAGPGLQPPGARPAIYDEHGMVPGMWHRTPAAPPPWLQVIATTLRLWLSRRWPWRRRGAQQAKQPEQSTRSLPWIRAATLVLVVLLAAGGGVALSWNGKPGGKQTQGNSTQSNAVLTAQAARNAAAAWIAGQVSRNTIVACDPVMCSVLQSHGYPPGNLDVLGPNAPDPLDSSVIVATSVLRSQFGSRLTSVYAPVVMASFGTGSAGVDVRVVAPDGAPVYLRQLSADVTARKSLGAELLRDPRVAAEPAARRQLGSGVVDPRLLLTISTMSALHPLSIVSFGDGAAGATAGEPLRQAILFGGLGDSPADTGAGLAALASFLRGQQPPYLPAVLQTVRLATGDRALLVRFPAPAPLGLIDPGQPAVKSSS